MTCALGVVVEVDGAVDDPFVDLVLSVREKVGPYPLDGPPKRTLIAKSAAQHERTLDSTRDDPRSTGAICVNVETISAAVSPSPEWRTRR
jgi:hypothetical protein